jgi:hypothetical protein
METKWWPISFFASKTAQWTTRRLSFLNVAPFDSSATTTFRKDRASRIRRTSLINTATGQVTVRYQDKGREKVKADHLNLPPDLANGILLILLKNILPDTKETKVSYIGADPKPRLVHLSITPNGEETFSVAGARHKATLFVVKVEIGGIAGMIAPVVGKKPADTKVWVVHEGAPAFVRADEALYVSGPIWSIQMIGPEWGRAAHSGH